MAMKKSSSTDVDDRACSTNQEQNHQVLPAPTRTQSLIIWFDLQEGPGGFR